MSARGHHLQFQTRLKDTLNSAREKADVMCTTYGLRMPNEEVNMMIAIRQFSDTDHTTRQEKFYSDASAQLLNWLAISRWMKAAQFTNLDGVSTILRDLDHLKTIEKGIKDVTTELLLHLSSRTGDTDMAEPQDQSTPEDSHPPVSTRTRKYKSLPEIPPGWNEDSKNERMQAMHARLLRLSK